MGKILSLTDLVKQAIGKELDLMGGDEVAYHVVMSDDGSVFEVTKKQFDTIKLKDNTPKKRYDIFYDVSVKGMMANVKQFNKKIEYNKKIRNMKSSKEKYDYLKRNGLKDLNKKEFRTWRWR